MKSAARAPHEPTFTPRLSLAALAMGVLLAVYAFMSVAHACGFAQRMPPNPEEAAFAALRDGRVRDALGVFEKTGNAGWIARLRFQLGMEARAQGLLTMALKELRAAVAANGTHIGAVAELVRTLALTGHLDDAHRVLGALKAPMMAEPMVQSARARVLAAKGDLRGAVAILTSLDRAGRLPTEDRVWMGKLHLKLFKPGALDGKI